MKTEDQSNQITAEPVEIAESAEIASNQITIIAKCPKHGDTEYVIESTIPGHEGVWCQLCWLESLGPSLPYIKRRVTES